MDLNKAIRALLEEKKRLNRVIASLEEMQKKGPAKQPKRKRLKDSRAEKQEPLS
jgi:hypothetical protein